VKQSGVSKVNSLNAVTPSWFRGNKQEAYSDEYDSIWEYDDLEFGIDYTNSYISIDIFDSKRWTRSPTRRNHVGSFAFSKKVKGGIPTWKTEVAMLSKNLQGQGIGSAVYSMMALNGYPIQSGNSMSVGAATMWSRLSQHPKLEVLTQIKDTWHLFEDFSAEDVFTENKLVLFEK
jgi:hypothetical protein